MVGVFLGVQATVRTSNIVGEEAQGVWNLAATFLRVLQEKEGIAGCCPAVVCHGSRVLPVAAVVQTSGYLAAAAKSSQLTAD